MPELSLELLFVLVLANTGMLALQFLNFLRWRLRAGRKPKTGDRKCAFTVTLSTDSGARARDAFFVQPLKDGETIEFCENGVRRGIR